MSKVTGKQLEQLYHRYSKREYVDPDPLLFLYDYDDVRDREIAGVIASSLAYGRVAQILKSVAGVLVPMGGSPREFIDKAVRSKLVRMFGGFKHRFTTGEDIVDLILSMKKTVKEYGSINECYVSAFKNGAAADAGIAVLAENLNPSGGYLVPHPSKGSACKRLNLYLRWMVRSDEVDPGGWSGVSPSKLIVPLDTHLARIARDLGFSQRKSADLKMAVEVTDAFRRFAPDDPVKYDFALTRFGIHTDLKNQDLGEALLF